MSHHLNIVPSSINGDRSAVPEETEMLRSYTRSPSQSLAVIFLGFAGLWSLNAADPSQAPSCAKDQIAAAETDCQQQKWEQAAVRLKQAVADFPNDPDTPEAQHRYADILSFIAPPDEGIAEYEKAIQMAPGTPVAQKSKIGIAALKWWLDEKEEARQLFKEVLFETKDWATIKECVLRMKQLGRETLLEKNHPRPGGKDCGPQALGDLLKLEGIQTADRELNSIVPTGARGVSMKRLSQAAETKGLKVTGVKLPLDQLLQAPKPFIAHLRNKHYLVVTDINPRRVSFIDWGGRREYTSLEVFKVLWDGTALVPTTRLTPSTPKRLLSGPEMEAAVGGHHLHGTDQGDPNENPRTGYQPDPSAGCGSGLPHWTVNLANFNFLIKDTVFIYRGRGPAVELTLTYNADGFQTSVFGRCWTCNYNVRLNVVADGMDVWRGGGKKDHFLTRGDGTFIPPVGNYDQLVSNADGTYAMRIKNTKQTQFFDSQGKLTRISDRNGNALSFQYNGDKLTSITDAAGRVTAFTYNANGNVSAVVDPLGRRATFQYDTNNDLVTYVDMATNVITYTYDSIGYMTSYSIPSGITQIHYGTTAFFTELPYVVREVVDPLGNSTRFDTGPTIVWVDARGNRTYYYNDTSAQTTEITDPLGHKTVREFTSGNLTGMTDANGNKTTFAYDSRGNLTSATDPLGNTGRLDYDTRDNLVRVIDPLGRTNSFAYDANDNLVRMTDAKGGITSAGYNGVGQLTSLTDPRTSTLVFAYDPQGNVTNFTDPLGGRTAYTYDAVGRLASKTDPKGQLFRYAFEGIDRVMQITLPDGTVRRYTYDCCALASISDSAGTVGFAYDAAKRLVRFTNTFNQVIQYGYDANGNLAALTYPDGKVVRYEYDGANRLCKVTDWLGNTTAYSYDPVGNLALSTNSNGTVARYQYDPLNQLATLINSKADGSIIAGYKYSTDSLGCRTNVALLAGLLPSFASANVTSTYDVDNRIQTTSGAIFTHDVNGNLTAIGGTKPTTFTYDAFDRLVQVAFTNYSAVYQYSALGNRIARTVNGKTDRFILDPRRALSRVLAETDGTGNVTAYYVYGLGLISKVTPTGQAYCCHFDGLGSTTATTDSAGNVVNKYAYDPFGNLSGASAETIPNPFHYVGRLGVMDEANGLLYMQARYYLPNAGRFINKDPIGFRGGPNPYLYVVNNPINYADPNGEIFIFLAPLAPYVIAAAVGAGLAVWTWYAVHADFGQDLPQMAGPAEPSTTCSLPSPQQPYIAPGGR
jgi:RHS repeat-associated protein